MKTLEISYNYTINRFFSFPTLKMVEEFLKNFKSDLKFVKELL